MRKNKKTKNKEILIDQEYIKICLAQSPKQRLDELARLNRFVKTAMPAVAKNAWKKLKEKGF